MIMTSKGVAGGHWFGLYSELVRCVYQSLMQYGESIRSWIIKFVIKSLLLPEVFL